MTMRRMLTTTTFLAAAGTALPYVALTQRTTDVLHAALLGVGGVLIGTAIGRLCWIWRKIDRMWWPSRWFLASCATMYLQIAGSIAMLALLILRGPGNGIDAGAVVAIMIGGFGSLVALPRSTGADRTTEPLPSMPAAAD